MEHDGGFGGALKGFCGDDPFGCVRMPEDNLDDFLPGSPWGRSGSSDNGQAMAVLATVAVLGVIGLAFGLLSKK